ncbi:MAG: DNA recombination protein RmuC [Candidatus Eremiobacteraeota bacterium]|nr:DNA recombination protein RmuC [Candidatus Eremiobacteraeota bacterium]
MTVAPTMIVIPFLWGALFAVVLVWLAVVVPARKETAAKVAALCEREVELAALRVVLATIRSQSAHALERITALTATGAELARNLERSAARTGEVERALASATATIDQMRLSEKDVDARLQRVAATYVNEAREVLVNAAAERFQGDAAAFRERLSASVAPLNERIDVLGKSLTDLGVARTQDQERVATLLEGLNAKMAGIDDATRRVERVLGNSQARGSWGEFELKRLLELTGMTEHVSFNTQESGYGSDAAGRPDVVLRIPGNLTVPIDAKVPFARYQEAVSAQSEAEREPLLDQAVAAIRGHVKVLGARRYHDRAACIGWTIMFVPIEAMLATLFARDHEIFEVAKTARVLIASPLTLMLYLEAFSRGWAAQKQSENAALILDEARTLVMRLSNFTEKFGKVGTTLNSALDKYNEAVATYEGRLGPQARKIVALRGDTEEAPLLTEQLARARVVDESRLPLALPRIVPAPDRREAR